MLGYYTSINVEQRRHCFLRCPNRLVFIQHLYAILLARCHERKELCRAVSYFKLLCHCLYRCYHLQI